MATAKARTVQSIKRRMSIVWARAAVYVNPRKAARKALSAMKNFAPQGYACRGEKQSR
jgi:hypothetical protein